MSLINKHVQFVFKKVIGLINANIVLKLKKYGPNIKIKLANKSFILNLKINK